MSENLTNALLISLIGMGLVFISLLVLWAAMALMMRLTAEKPRVESAPDEAQLESDLRRKAAIAAVVVAIAREADTDLHEFPLPPTAFVSAWQAVMRGNIIKKRGSVR